jgi:hypothetical protein
MRATGYDLSAPVPDFPHVFFIAVPMPPKFRVCPNFNSVHALWDCERRYLFAQSFCSRATPFSPY